LHGKNELPVFAAGFERLVVLNSKNPDSRSIKKWAVPLFLVLLAGTIRVPSLVQPLGPDQGIMSVIGEGILKGKLPYRDLWEMATPAIFYTYAAMFALFGKTMAAIPITDILVSMLTTFLIYLVGKRIWGEHAGWWSAGLFAIFSNGVRLGMHAAGDVAFGTFWYVSQRETFMLPLLTACALLILTATCHRRRSWMLFFAGICGGAAFLYKFPSALIFGIFALYLIGETIGRKPPFLVKTLLRENALLAAGFLLALAPATLFFIAKGALGDMIDVVFGFVYSVYGQARHDFLTVAKIGLSHTIFLASEQFLLWTTGAAASIFILSRERKAKNVLVVLWAASAMLYVASHMEFFGYHYLMVLPPLSLLTGYGLDVIFGSDSKWWRTLWAEPRRVIVTAAILANLFVYTTFVHTHYMKFLQYSLGKITQEQYYGFFTAYPKHDYSFPADYKVIQYIKTRTNPQDKIYSLGGIESVIYFLSQRESPSRFIFSWILFSYAHGRAPMSEAYRRELLADIEKDPPAYIVTVRPLEWFREYTGIFKYVSEHYTLAEVFPDDRYVYARR
jgi:hypothetical protein